MVFGDPHILPFDASGKKGADQQHRLDKVLFLHSGDFWLVKSKSVEIQAQYFSSNSWGWSSARAVAVGGPFLGGNTLIIDHANITWNGEQIMPNVLGTFRNEHINVRAMLKQRGKKNRPAHVFRVQLPWDITLMAARFTWGRRMDIVIKMRPLLEGQDGHCGNFNGVLADDTTKTIQERFGVQVQGEELLFSRKEYQYVGCFKDDKSDRDLPVLKRLGKNRRHLDLEACSTICSGYKFFARQGNGKCFCGNSYGRHGPASHCRCDSNQIGHLKNCIYRYGEGEAEEPRDDNCPQARRAEAERLCTAALFTEPGLIEACVFDFCFGGEDAADFVEEDGFAAEMMADVDIEDGL